MSAILLLCPRRQWPPAVASLWFRRMLWLLLPWAIRTVGRMRLEVPWDAALRCAAHNVRRTLARLLGKWRGRIRAWKCGRLRAVLTGGLRRSWNTWVGALDFRIREPRDECLNRGMFLNGREVQLLPNIEDRKYNCRVGLQTGPCQNENTCWNKKDDS